MDPKLKMAPIKEKNIEEIKRSIIHMVNDFSIMVVALVMNNEEQKEESVQGNRYREAAWEPEHEGKQHTYRREGRRSASRSLS